MKQQMLTGLMGVNLIHLDQLMLYLVLSVDQLWNQESQRTQRCNDDLTLQSSHDKTSQSNIHSLRKKQNEITTLLVQQQIAALLPHREIPVFNGNPLEYRTFIKAFEHLVKSCKYLSPNQGYQKAKSLLKKHFGNKSKIATAFLQPGL